MYIQYTMYLYRSVITRSGHGILINALVLNPNSFRNRYCFWPTKSIRRKNATFILCYVDGRERTHFRKRSCEFFISVKNFNDVISKTRVGRNDS